MSKPSSLVTKRDEKPWFSAAAVNPITGKRYAAVRIRHPFDKSLYFRSGGMIPWVKVGYNTWTIAEWIDRYSEQKSDTRQWEFFGEPIDLWPPGSEGYSDE
jgi:hypothetical protein